MRLQAIMADFPDWSIEVNVLNHEDRTVWREMMTEITHDRIIDRLRHDLLPQHLRQMRFGTTIDEYNEEMAAKVRRLMRKHAERRIARPSVLTGERRSAAPAGTADVRGGRP